MKKHGPIIYVVDDDVSVCRALSLLLKSHGLTVVTFTRAEDFLSFKHPKIPSCLVLDIRLPDINGLALQESMTARKLFLPIIFITGHGDIPMSVKAMKAGAIDFLPKPFTKKNCLMLLRLQLQKMKMRTRNSPK